MISTNSRDMFLMQQAAQCTLLMEALISSSKNTETTRCLHSEDVDKAVSLMSYYSKEETKHKLLIPADATQGL